MNRPRFLLWSHARLVALPLVLALVACHLNQSPLLSPRTETANSPDGQPYTTAHVQAAVKNGTQAKGWNIVSEEPGVITARIDSRGHYAVVRITYHAGGWAIDRVESSPGLAYEDHPGYGPIIHKTYNRWIKNLDVAIRNALGTAAPAATTTAGAGTDPLNVDEPPPDAQDGWEQPAPDEAAPPEGEATPEG